MTFGKFGKRQCLKERNLILVHKLRSFGISPSQISKNTAISISRVYGLLKETPPKIPDRHVVDLYLKSKTHESLSSKQISRDLGCSDYVAREILATLNLSLRQKSVGFVNTLYDDYLTFYQGLYTFLTDYSQLVVIDETIFKLDIEKSKQAIPAHKGQKYVLNEALNGCEAVIPALAAIDVNGCFYCDVLKDHGSYTDASLLKAFADILDNSNPYPLPRSILVIYNAPFHNKVWNLMKDMCEQRKVILISAPKGGYEASTIDFMFNSVKSQFRSLLSKRDNFCYRFAIELLLRSHGSCLNYFKHCYLLYSIFPFNDLITDQSS